MSSDAKPAAERRSILSGRALPDSDRVRASVAPFAARWILRGGHEVSRACAGAAFGATPPLGAIARGGAGAARRSLARARRMAADRREAEPGLAAALDAAMAGFPHSLIDFRTANARSARRPGAARLLNAGVPLDLDLAAFPVGMATRTLLLKAEITLWRRDAERFRLEVARSFAPYVAAVLTASARDQRRTEFTGRLSQAALDAQCRGFGSLAASAH